MVVAGILISILSGIFPASKKLIHSVNAFPHICIRYQKERRFAFVDKFLFQYSHYKILDTVKNQSWEGVPIPFQQCMFVFQDTFLLVESRMESGNVLKLRFEKEGKFLGATAITIKDYRWPRNMEINAVGSVPPDCLCEFIRFYQRLSVYLSQSREVTNTSAREIIQEDFEQTVDPAQKNRKELDERIICLGSLSAAAVFRHVKPFMAAPKHQQNPCDYAYWVRGHQRLCKSGVRTWVRPHTRTTQ